MDICCLKYFVLEDQVSAVDTQVGPACQWNGSLSRAPFLEHQENGMCCVGMWHSRDSQEIGPWDFVMSHHQWEGVGYHWSSPSSGGSFTAVSPVLQ